MKQRIMLLKVYFGGLKYKFLKEVSTTDFTFTWVSMSCPLNMKYDIKLAWLENLSKKCQIASLRWKVDYFTVTSP